jgi:hypothetical protein
METKITEKEIFEKYPEIFKQKDLPMTETCMCWGLCVPDFWLPVLDQLCYSFQNYNITSYVNGKAYPFPQVVAEQVKEKFNTLRFYYRLEYPEDVEVPDTIRASHSGAVDGMIHYADCCIETLTKQMKNDE